MCNTNYIFFVSFYVKEMIFEMAINLFKVTTIKTPTEGMFYEI